MLPAPDTAPDTRQRLLEAAAEVFSEHGYHRASIRQVCQHAAANVAAVHYHFGGKEELYLELLRELGRRAFERYPADHELGPAPSAEQRLFAFVQAFLLRVLSPDGFGRHGRLLSREMVEPSPAFAKVIDEFIRPHFEYLCGVVAELAGLAPRDPRVVLSSRSIVAQCVFYHHAHALLERLAPGEPRDAAALRRIAEHVARFSLDGLHGMREARA